MAQGVPGRLWPRIFLTSWHYKGGRSSAKHTNRLYPRRNPWYSLSEAESTSGHMVLSGVPLKKSPATTPGIDPGTSRPLRYPRPHIYIHIYTRCYVSCYNEIVNVSIITVKQLLGHLAHAHPEKYFCAQCFHFYQIQKISSYCVTSQ